MGEELEGIKINSPDILKELPEDSYKVIICIKNYVPIMRQLEKEFGVSNYSVYDWHQDYPRKLPVRAETASGSEAGGSKKYHIGTLPECLTCSMWGI